MILLIGVKTDPVLRYFFDQNYVRRDKRIVFINTERIGQDILISDLGWTLPSGEVLPHNQITGVYNRMVSSMKSPMMYYLNWLLDECYPNVINRPKDTLSNFSKVWQLTLARSLGFEIPATQIYANQKITGEGDYIYKSISSVRSIVERVENNRQKKVNEPVIFQPDKGRHNIRVHVLNDQYVAQEVISNEVDYRYDLHARFAQQCQVPLWLRHKILRLSKELGLVFSGIDFLFEDGRYYFLEINPSPGYAYFEKQLSGTPISTMLYKMLRDNE